MPDTEEMKALEQKLARLVPVALSADGQQGIEEMLDRLAVEAPVKGQELRPQTTLLKWGASISGIAAALVAGAWLAQNVSSPGGGAIVSQSAIPVSSMQLVGEFDHVSDVVVDGLREDPDGLVLHAVQLSAVERDELLDEESGLVVQIVQPREEVIFFPITSF